MYRLPALGFFALCASPLAFGGATLVSGPIAIGINDAGNLIYSDGSIESVNASENGLVGIAVRNPSSGSYYDAIAAGSLAEGWGVAANKISGWASHSSYFGRSNLTIDGAFAAGGAFTSLTSLTTGPALTVSQTYAPSAESPTVLFQDSVTLTNTGDTDLTDVKYVRVLDWDVPPTEYKEFITVVGTETASYLVRSHDNGFYKPDPLLTTSPLDPDTLNQDYSDIGPHDSGAYFLFNFGTLAPGESIEFSIYFGAAYSEPEALNAIFDVGAELYGLAQSSKTDSSPTDGTPYTFIFAFKGVGGDAIMAVPEPAALSLVLGLAAIAILPRRRRQ